MLLPSSIVTNYFSRSHHHMKIVSQLWSLVGAHSHTASGHNTVAGQLVDTPVHIE